MMMADDEVCQRTVWSRYLVFAAEPLTAIRLVLISLLYMEHIGEDSLGRFPVRCLDVVLVDDVVELVVELVPVMNTMKSMMMGDTGATTVSTTIITNTGTIMLTPPTSPSIYSSSSSSSSLCGLSIRRNRGST